VSNGPSIVLRNPEGKPRTSKTEVVVETTNLCAETLLATPVKFEVEHFDVENGILSFRCPDGVRVCTNAKFFLIERPLPK
jgi:hypothetical protein